MNSALPYLLPTFVVMVGIVLQWRDGSAIRTEIAALRSEFNSRFASMDSRFTSLESRMESRFAALDAKFDRRFDTLTADMVLLHERVAKVEAANI